MKFSIPFIPDDTYTKFLIQRIKKIDAVYFSLYTSPLLDARMPALKPVYFDQLCQTLARFDTIKKYALLNSRFIHPDRYGDKDFLNQTIDKLEILVTRTGLTGIVFTDAYFLNALAGTKRKIIGSLEAVPGINCMLDSAHKIFSFLALIENSGFKAPGKLILDRSLNREIQKLEDVVPQIKAIHPEMRFELLANEGCIHHCPFKLAHDAQISFSNLDIAPDKNFSTNQALGCHAYFYRSPSQFLKSPFIRPEDIDNYSSFVQTIKLCGRTLGITFLKRCIQAYCKKSHDGNLLEIMDATCWFADLYHIDNKKLDPGFFNALTHCTKACKKCTVCHDLFIKAANKKSIELKCYKDYL